MTTTVHKTDNRLHAVQNGATLCGAPKGQEMPSMIATPMTAWATLSTFSGGCADCLTELKTQPLVRKYVK
jgi:hypothetical protein